jgi:two-component system sensor histidine kinase UhpB
VLAAAQLARRRAPARDRPPGGRLSGGRRISGAPAPAPPPAAPPPAAPPPAAPRAHAVRPARSAFRRPLTHLRPQSGAEWLALYVAARLAATVVAASLLLWGGVDGLDLLLVLYGPASTALLLAWPSLRRSPAAWAADSAITLALVLHSGDWRSPYYLMWLASLALPAVHLPLRRAVLLAIGASLVFLVTAVVGGPAPGRLQLVSTETLAIHLSLPLLLVSSLAYAADSLRRLNSERMKRERLAIEAERRRIAWELHDSAKQRIHAAHLLVSSLQDRVAPELTGLVGRATIELESASSDMDTSLAELRSPLEGRRLDEALRIRARELAPGGRPAIAVEGSAPTLTPLVAAHVYRIATEAIVNALRHADAGRISVRLTEGEEVFAVAIRDDGRGMPISKRPGATGLRAMENRAASIGADLILTTAEDGTGTLVELLVPRRHARGGST